MTIAWLAGLALGGWLYLLIARGDWWRADVRDSAETFPSPPRWPSVAAVIPARDEAAVVETALRSVLAQDYAGELRVILVDDNSTDGTAEIARATGDPRLTVLEGKPLPAGWTGKLWALEQGVAEARGADYLWLTDADIVHAPGVLAHLSARAEAGQLAMASLMAKLRTDTADERAMIPAFVHFFQMLYPFAWVNDPARSTAAAAGGCLLARRAALEAAGGLGAVRDAIIDDCALGRLLKAQGPVWLGLTDRSASLRGYGSMDAIVHMIARSAYAQLGYDPLKLVGALVALFVLFAGPVIGTITAAGPGLGAWILMALMFQPMLKFYGLPGWWGVALPFIGMIYWLATVRSALRYHQGRGGEWKGRAQAAGT